MVTSPHAEKLKKQAVDFNSHRDVINFLHLYCSEPSPTELSISLIGDCHVDMVAHCLAYLNPRIKTYAYRVNLPHLKPNLEELRKSDFLFAGHFVNLKQYNLEHPRVVRLPATAYRAFHPDVTEYIQIDGKPLLGLFGAFHSKIALESYLRRYSQEEAYKAFNAVTYEKLGYFNIYEHAFKRLAENYKAVGLDAATLVPKWHRRGCFMFTIPHPKIHVILDLTKEVMRLNKIPIILEDSERYLREHFNDAIWPVYPEIAENLYIKEEGSYYFHLNGHTIDLREFIEISYMLYDKMGCDWSRSNFDRLHF